ncbi:DNA polymerase Y family protein [Catellatospora sichuanensis]|uniref:DNA polymerase Y family protein n=1 Tax=Catellatospora sichuanensis TaxID=1969805 RepID=UPI001182943E|nr:DNA polymerase Y family protein [Catellatospora sichuanensis]
MTHNAVRTMLVWCPDWPVAAAVLAGEAAPDAATAVLHANRVVACSPAARAAGIRRNLRKRDAQSRCPDLTVVAYDQARDAVMFEPVVAAIEEVAAGVAIVRPGSAAFAARGPARYFGSEHAAAERIIEQVAVDAGVEAQIGVADGIFAALLAARAGHVIPDGETPAYLAAMPITAIDRSRLVDLLRRMGVTTLGAFAALPASQVLDRFGIDGAIAHRLAAGRDDRPLHIRQPPPDLIAAETFDDPIERVDAGAFAARALAVQLHERLTGHGLAATRLEIVAVTAQGQELSRLWRHDGLLTEQAIADRTRWQLDGWLTRRKLTSGLIALRLIPHGLVRHAGLQPGLWGEAGPGRDRAHRALHRVQGLLGPEAVMLPIPAGGRDPEQMVTLRPFGDERQPARPPGPWPGALLAPYPAVHGPAEPVRLVDRTGADIGVDARLQMSASPARIQRGRGQAAVVEWFGPWAVAERWWDTNDARRAVRLQVVLDDGEAVQLGLTAGRWTITGRFD